MYVSVRGSYSATKIKPVSRCSVQKLFLILLILATPLLAQANNCRGTCSYRGVNGDPYMIRMCQNIFNGKQCEYTGVCVWDQPRVLGQCNYIGLDGDPYKIRMCQNIYNDRQCGYVPGCAWDDNCN